MIAIRMGRDNVVNKGWVTVVIANVLGHRRTSRLEAGVYNMEELTAVDLVSDGNSITTLLRLHTQEVDLIEIRHLSAPRVQP